MTGKKVMIKLGMKSEITKVIKENHRTIWVELPNGNVIKRHNHCS